MSTITRKNLQNLPAVPSARDVALAWMPSAVMLGALATYFLQLGVWTFVSAFLTPDVQKRIGSCGGSESINRYYLDNGYSGQPVVHEYDAAANLATCTLKTEAALHPWHMASWYIVVGVIAVALNFAWDQLCDLLDLDFQQRDVITTAVNIVTAILSVAGIAAFALTGVHLVGVVMR